MCMYVHGRADAGGLVPTGAAVIGVHTGGGGGGSAGEGPRRGAQSIGGGATFVCCFARTHARDNRAGEAHSK